MNAHLVTGATGFLGAATVIELLRRTDDPVFCLVRGENAGLRLGQILTRAATVYGCDDVFPDLPSRVTAISGNMERPGNAEAALRGVGITHVWHVAASLKFRARDADEIHQTNVVGTEELCAMAGRLGAETFVYFSTAFVGGCGEREFDEYGDVQGEPSNEYEASKRLAERHVLAERNTGFRSVVVRPSIVMGHSGTRAALSDMGVYGFAESLYRLRCLGAEHIREVFSSRPMRLVGDPTVEINLVPVDAVAQSAVHLGLSKDARGIYNLTNRQGTSVLTCFEAVCDLLDVPMPEFTQTADGLEVLDRMIAKHTEFHAPYLKQTRAFGRSRDEELPAASNLDIAYDVRELKELLQWYLDNEIAAALEGASK